MASRDLTAIVGVDLRTWPRPPADSVDPKDADKLIARCDALQAVAGGMSFRAAGAAFGVDPRTVATDAEKAVQLHPDGKPIGFRTCIPFRYRMPKPKKEKVAPPTKGAAYSFTRLLEAYLPLKELVHGYLGPLPSGKAKTRAFDRHFGTFKAKARTLMDKSAYPLSEPDEGRRALLEYHKRLRKQRREVGAAEVDATPPTTKRFNQLFTLAPLDRCEFDAHKQDVDWVLEIPNGHGELVQRRITKITLLALVCAVSRYLLSYLLVLGEYNHLHVLRLFCRALNPWQRRELIVPGMSYADGAVLGLPVDEYGCGVRSIVTAGDNALSHLANLTVNNLVDHYRGVFNFGKAHVPEGRPIIEAFFRRLEQGALRSIAGGFHPQSRANPDKVSTSYLRAEDHPLHWVGMEDLMDVIASGYNVTQHSGLNNRLPSTVMHTHLASGWTWRATEAARDALKVATIRLNVKIRGDKEAKRHPFVQYKDGIYRSQRLMGQWSRIGESFPAEVSIEDLRYMVLLDQADRTPWSRLAALPPWHLSPHDLHLRQQINQARHRGLLQINGSEDAVKAYHAFAHTEALKARAVADQYARLEFQHGFHTGASPSVAPPQPAVEPRAGRTSFALRKD
jgi:hypothetical protein